MYYWVLLVNVELVNWPNWKPIGCHHGTCYDRYQNFLQQLYHDIIIAAAAALCDCAASYIIFCLCEVLIGLSFLWFLT